MEDLLANIVTQSATNEINFTTLELFEMSSVILHSQIPIVVMPKL